MSSALAEIKCHGVLIITFGPDSEVLAVADGPNLSATAVEEQNHPPSNFVRCRIEEHDQAEIGHEPVLLLPC